MKINKTVAVEFMLALGFESAEEWDNDKLVNRLGQVPSRLTIDAVPDKHHKLYNDLKDNKETIEIVEGGSEKAAKKGKAAKAEKPSKAGKAAKGEKAEKPAKEKKVREPKPEKERDAYGCAVGTKRAAINATFSKEWITDAQCAEQAGVTLRQARSRLRRATKAGILIKERLIRYRLAPATKDEAKTEKPTKSSKKN